MVFPPLISLLFPHRAFLQRISGKTGKSGGVRLIYYNRLANGQIWLLTIYGKSAVDQLDKKVLRALVEKLNESLK